MKFWRRNWVYVVAAIIFALLVAAQAEVAKDADQRAIKTLQDAGYTEISLSGRQYLGCGKDDYINYGFIAKGPTGRTVMGVTCSGLDKYTTIRFH